MRAMSNTTTQARTGAAIFFDVLAELGVPAALVSALVAGRRARTVGADVPTAPDAPRQA